MSIENHAISATNALTLQSSPERTEPFWGEDGLTFADFLDIANPLQHIPLVSDIYQSATGDEQSNGSKIIGAGLYGGIFGLISSFFDSALEQETGKSIGQTALAFFETPEAETSPKNAFTLNNIDADAQEQIREVIRYAAKQESSTTHLNAEETAEILAEVKATAFKSVNAILAQANRPTISQQQLDFLRKDWELKEILEIVAHATPSDIELTSEELAFINATEKYQQGETYEGKGIYDELG